MTTIENSGELDARPVASAITTGFRGKCPACGTGALFSNQLYIRDHCEHCNEELFHHRADDLPAYLNILVVGHVVLGVMMIVMGWNLLEMWPLIGVTVAIAVATAFLLMRPLKGAVLGAQWAMRMHGFGGHDD